MAALRAPAARARAGPRRRSAGAARARSAGAPGSPCWAAATPRPACYCLLPLTAAAGSVVTNIFIGRTTTCKASRELRTLRYSGSHDGYNQSWCLHGRYAHSGVS